MAKEEIKLELWISDEQLAAWNKMANRMCLNIYEYIRRCTDAHTNILKKDSFHLVPEDREK